MKELPMQVPGRITLVPVLAALLAGCAGGMGMHHGDMIHGHDSASDMSSMCAMHKQMMAGKTAAEQQSLMDEHMKSMTPEMRQRMQTAMGQCN